jgi:ketosteroid isomerase-like protein
VVTSGHCLGSAGPWRRHLLEGGSWLLETHRVEPVELTRGFLAPVYRRRDVYEHVKPAKRPVGAQFVPEASMHTTATHAADVVRRAYSAYENHDRDLIEDVIADDYTFSSPPDPHLDRKQYFERCWPNHETITGFRFLKILEHDGEVFVTYELEHTDGSRGRNTEYHVVEGDKIKRTDVYFGPTL